jgi:hypothetical protein
VPSKKDIASELEEDDDDYIDADKHVKSIQVVNVFSSYNSNQANWSNSN